MIADSAVYVRGERVEDLEGVSPGGLHAASRSRAGVAWIELLDPTQEELEEVAEGFGLPAETVGELSNAHRRPRTERYGGSTFVALLTARYLDEPEQVEFGEIQVLAGPDYLLSVRHDDSSELGQVRRELEKEPEVIARGPRMVLYAILDRVVGDYAPVVEGLEDNVAGIEAEVFGGSSGVSRRIYELSREVIRFERAAGPLAGVLERLAEEIPGNDEAARGRLRELRGRLLRITEQVEGLRSLLSSILNVNLTLVSVQQADQTKKISAWAAILAVPTVITGVYGMNFRYMPELSWPLGYPLALCGMAAICIVLYLLFRRSGWL
jgi:magnesium transporter